MRFPGNTDEINDQAMVKMTEIPESEDITLAEIVKIIASIQEKLTDMEQRQISLEKLAAVNQLTVSPVRDMVVAGRTGNYVPLDEKIMQWLHTAKITAQLAAAILDNIEMIADMAVKVLKKGDTTSLPGKNDSAQFDIVSIINLLKQLGILK